MYTRKKKRRPNDVHYIACAGVDKTIIHVHCTVTIQSFWSTYLRQSGVRVIVTTWRNNNNVIIYELGKFFQDIYSCSKFRLPIISYNIFKQSMIPYFGVGRRTEICWLFFSTLPPRKSLNVLYSADFLFLFIYNRKVYSIQIHNHTLKIRWAKNGWSFWTFFNYNIGWTSHRYGFPEKLVRRIL